MTEPVQEPFLSNLQKLQKLRLIITAGHSFVFRDYSSVSYEKRHKVIRIPKGIANFLGLKDKSAEEFLYPVLVSSPLAYIILVLSILFGASLAPIFLSFTSKIPVLWPTWRVLCNMIAFLPLVWRERNSEPRKAFDYSSFFSRKALFLNFQRSLLYTGWGLMFAYALSKTSVYSALILANSHIFIIVLWKILRKRVLPCFSYFAAFLVGCGIALMFFKMELSHFIKEIDIINPLDSPEESNGFSLNTTDSEAFATMGIGALSQLAAGFLGLSRASNDQEAPSLFESNSTSVILEEYFDNQETISKNQERKLQQDSEMTEDASTSTEEGSNAPDEDSASTDEGTTPAKDDDSTGPEAPSSNEEEELWKEALMGNFYALVASLFSTVFYFRNREIDTDIPYCLRLFGIHFFSFIVSALIAIFGFGALPFSIDPQNGLFGFVHPENISHIVLLTLFTCYGTFGLYMVLAKLFDPLIIENALLLEPIVSCILSYMIGCAPLPEIWSVLAILLIIPGLSLITIGEQQIDDRFEAGEIGIPASIIARLRFKHYENLTRLNLNEKELEMTSTIPK